jgi:hypothetical protein
MKLYCYKCKGAKNVNVLCKDSIGSDNDEGYQWSETYHLVKCQGCDGIFLAVSSWTEDSVDYSTGESEVAWKFYPQGATHREEVDYDFELPPKINRIYKENISALNAQLPILAGIGIRALIEAICKDKKIVGRSLEKLINGLATDGILAKSQADILHSHRFMGNEAAHEVTPPKPKELIAALDIAETILKTIYLLPKLSAEIQTGRKKTKPPASHSTSSSQQGAR